MSVCEVKDKMVVVMMMVKRTVRMVRVMRAWLKDRGWEDDGGDGCDDQG